jgi:hypothetical protein
VPVRVARYYVLFIPNILLWVYFWGPWDVKFMSICYVY